MQEQIIGKMNEAEVIQAKDQTVVLTCPVVWAVWAVAPLIAIGGVGGGCSRVGQGFKFNRIKFRFLFYRLFARCRSQLGLQFCHTDTGCGSSFLKEWTLMKSVKYETTACFCLSTVIT